MRVKGKLIRRSLRTQVRSVAKLRLGDLEREERQIAEHATACIGGKMSLGDALAIYRACCPSALFPRASWLVVIAAIIGIANPTTVASGSILRGLAMPQLNHCSPHLGIELELGESHPARRSTCVALGEGVNASEAFLI